MTAGQGMEAEPRPKKDQQGERGLEPLGRKASSRGMDQLRLN